MPRLISGGSVVAAGGDTGGGGGGGTPSQAVLARAVKNQAQDLFPAWSQIDFDTVTHSGNGAMTSAGYVCPVAGVYLVSVGIYFNPATDEGRTFSIAVRKNGQSEELLRVGSLQQRYQDYAVLTRHVVVDSPQTVLTIWARAYPGNVTVLGYPGNNLGTFDVWGPK